MRLLPSGTVTFVLSDIEGSSRRWEDDEADSTTLAVPGTAVELPFRTPARLSLDAVEDFARAVAAASFRRERP